MSGFVRIGEQVAAMKAHWPMLKARRVNRADQSARWVGKVRPNLADYQIELRYAGGWPTVRVLSPALKALPGNSQGRLPHVYGPVEDPTLCLFDPAAEEWAPSMLLSKSIVPWTLDWLTCYEFWLITGEWIGGGRHPVTTEPQGREEVSQ